MHTSSVFSEDSKKASKASASSNSSGSKKLSSAQSSWRLFCSGVPVNSSRAEVLNSRTTLDSSESSFLMRCASSITKYFHSIFLNVDFSRHAISKDVTTISNFPGLTSESCLSNLRQYLYFGTSKASTFVLVSIYLLLALFLAAADVDDAVVRQPFFEFLKPV